MPTRNVQPDRNTTLREAEALLGIIEPVFPIKYRAEYEREAQVWAYVARCSALLRAMLTLMKRGEEDAIGVLYRSLVETWLFGVYLIEMGPEGLDELFTDMSRRADKINRILGKPLLGGDGQQLHVETVADRLKGKVGDDFFKAVYDIHYRIGSFHDSHGHLGALVGNLQVEQGAITVHYRRHDPDHLAAPELFLAMAVSLCAGIAGRASDETGLDVPGLADFLDRWRSYEIPVDEVP